MTTHKTKIKIFRSRYIATTEKEKKRKKNTLKTNFKASHILISLSGNEKLKFEDQHMNRGIFRTLSGDKN